MKMVKVSHRLYHQVDDEREKPIKWRKQFDWLDIRLTEVRAYDGVSLNIKGVGSSEENRLSDIRSILAKGKFENQQLICLIEAGLEN